jgi:hypothetical protein
MMGRQKNEEQVPDLPKRTTPCACRTAIAPATGAAQSSTFPAARAESQDYAGFRAEILER